MEYTRFIEFVRERGQFESDEEAKKATDLVFEALKERLSGDEADPLAELLPEQLKRSLMQSRKAPGIGTEKFLDILARKENGNQTLAGYHARTVCSVIASALPEEHLPDVISALPEDVKELFMVEAWVKERHC